MLNCTAKFTELEEHLFKLVEHEESLSSHFNTPIIKTKTLFRDGNNNNNNNNREIDEKKNEELLNRSTHT
jgi:hypothetical protein